MPKYLLKFFLKFSLVLGIFTVLRLFFFFFNADYFEGAGLWDFFIGFLFDIVCTAILFLPLLFVELFPHRSMRGGYFRFISKWLFFTVLTFAVVMNLADIEYFKFTSARSSISTLKMLAQGNDFAQQLPSFLRDFWYLFFLAFLTLWSAWWLYEKIDRLKDDDGQISVKKQLVYFFGASALVVLLGRGTGLRPIEPIHVTSFVEAEKVPLVLNSAFTIIKSWGKKGLEEKHYFSEEALNEWLQTARKYEGEQWAEKPNVVVFLLESFSSEFIGSLNGSKKTWTPFLDSLMKQGVSFSNCYATGKKSLDAVPAVLSSIPNLMEQEFILSDYVVNSLESLPLHLGRLGYESAFFHGATNGSMNFEQFAYKIGFDHYFGRSEYGHDEDFDGTWGIFDEPFFKWSADRMTGLSSPFLGVIFSLSSHPPYVIPEKYRERFSGGETPMHNCIAYADYALQQFFAYAKQQPWYEHTLFVLLADHTPASKKPEYFKGIGSMHIPLLFFHPGDTSFQGVESRVVSQMDVMPSVLDLLGYDQAFYAFGHSVFSEESFNVSYIGRKYLIHGRGHLLVWFNEQPLGLYALDDKLMKHNLLDVKPELASFLENKLKAYIQRYRHDLIYNAMRVLPGG